MNVLMVAIGTTGDVQPMVVLGTELMRRGHTATICAFEALRPHIEGAGITHFPLPGDAEKFISNIIKPGANPLTYLHRLEASLGDVFTSLLDALYEACQGRDILVPTFFGSFLYAIAQELNIPLVQANYCFTDLTGDACLPVMKQPPLGRWFNRGTYRLAYRMIGSFEHRFIDPWCQAHNITPRNTAKGLTYTINGHTVPVLYALSEAVVPRPPEWPKNIHITGFWEPTPPEHTPSEALCRFLSAGDTAPIYIGFGSMNTGDGQRAFQALQKALAQTGLRAVVSAGWGAMDAQNAPGCENMYCLHEYVPHRWLFEHVSAVVHHGGAGTTASGLSAGKPTLVVPFGSDQFFWGDHVRALGCGPKPLPRAKLSAGKLSRALMDLAGNPSYRDNAEMIMLRLQCENGASTAVDIIEHTHNTYKI